MSIWLFLFGSILVIILVIAGSITFIYGERVTQCRVYPNMQCYTDWLCQTAGGGTENLYTERTEGYLSLCGRNATDPTSTCVCVPPPDAPITDPNIGNGSTTWSTAEAAKSAAVTLCS